jgi:hypothetical protein
MGPDVLNTIRDAAVFIAKLPKKSRGGHHWGAAGVSLQAAHDYPDDPTLLSSATDSMELALRTEGILQE